MPVQLGPTAVALYCFVLMIPIFGIPAAAHGFPASRDLVLLLILGRLLTTVSHIAFIASMRTLTAAYASVIVSIQPLLATAIAWVWLGESIGPRTAVGGVLVLSAVGLSIGWRLRFASP